MEEEKEKESIRQKLFIKRNRSRKLSTEFMTDSPQRKTITVKRSYISGEPIYLNLSLN